MKDSFGARGTLEVGTRTYGIARLKALADKGHDLNRLPFALKILLENLLRNEDGVAVTSGDIEALVNWDPKSKPTEEIAFTPARVVLQDFTGVPAVVDLAAMRDAFAKMGGDPKKVEPIQPAELVIDHSVQVDNFGTPQALEQNVAREYERNLERYAFLRWGQTAFDSFKVVPPGMGIVHQVNLEHLGRVVMDGEEFAYPDTVVGTDSHTTMINGLGVLGWGVGGIEAEAAMLGQPVSMLIPEVVGVRLTGELPQGATATDLVLRVVEVLREHGVVGKFVEFFGSGLKNLPLADRATLANMAPEYGATCGIFPVDETTLEYLRLSGRSQERIDLVEAYMKEQGLFLTADSPEAEYSACLEVDMSTIEPALAGPKRPQDRVLLTNMKSEFQSALSSLSLRDDAKQGGTAVAAAAQIEVKGKTATLTDGAVVIAAITSCTNTSNPSVMMAAGLLAKKAVELGLEVQPWVKTSLAPGSKVVSEYLEKAGVDKALNQLGFDLVGFGCTTCIGNSGPLPEPVAKAITDEKLVVASVLSGNRNFEGRVHAQVRANYLASPPLVVAYAIAGSVQIDLTTEPLGTGSDGNPVYLKDIWPSRNEVEAVLQGCIDREMFEGSYRSVFDGDERWQQLQVPSGATYDWDPDSTYVKHPPYFEDMPAEAPPIVDIHQARALAVLGDSITTDHISPAGAIAADSPAGRYLLDKGVSQVDFNSYGSRRGNHEVMMRGTFANIRLRNLLVPGVEGGFTKHVPSGEPMTIFDASERYRGEGTPTCILAGKEYGTGSSRDWAAKGPNLLGVRFVIAESYERIHRSNLIGMGILPLQFREGETRESLGLTGEETFDVNGLADVLVVDGFTSGRTTKVRATAADGKVTEFEAVLRIDTPNEVLYYQNGGILHYVLRRMA